MKALKTLRSTYNSLMCRATTAAVGMAIGNSAMAVDLTETDLSTTQSSQTAQGVMNNINSTAQTGAALLISLVSIGGFVVVALSLYQIYKASRDEREKPMGAIVGLFIGGLMAAVGTVMWVMRNSMITPAT